VLAIFLLLDFLTLTRRIVGVRGSLLGNASRAASAHPTKSFPTYALPVRSPVSRPAAIATGGLSKGGRGHKSYEGGNQHSIEIAHTWSSTPVLLRLALHGRCIRRRSRGPRLGLRRSMGQALATEAIAECIRSGGVWEAESNIELLDLVSTPTAADWDAAFTVKRWLKSSQRRNKVLLPATQPSAAGPNATRFFFAPHKGRASLPAYNLPRYGQQVLGEV
jgi:hypothetical protein